jgi:hypothetical protein
MKHRLALSLLVLGVLLVYKQQASAYHRLTFEPGFDLEMACNNNSCLFGLFGVKWDPDTGWPYDSDYKKPCCAGGYYGAAPAPYCPKGSCDGAGYQPPIPPVPAYPRVPPQARVPAAPPSPTVPPTPPVPPSAGPGCAPQGWGYLPGNAAPPGYPSQAVPVGYYVYPQAVPAYYYPYAQPSYRYGW